jgi:hypothetical protein
LHNHCFLPKREAQKLAFAHFNNLKQNFRWRPQFTDQRQQISHLLFLPVTNRWEICLRMRYDLRGLRERDVGRVNIVI